MNAIEAVIRERDLLVESVMARDAELALLRAEVERLRAKEDQLREDVRTRCGQIASEDVCPTCHGRGQRSYGSSAGWRRGAGGQTVTAAVCDQCWGSGDMANPGVDQRRMEAEFDRLRAEVERLRRDAALLAEWRAADARAIAAMAEYRALPVLSAWEAQATASQCKLAVEARMREVP